MSDKLHSPSRNRRTGQLFPLIASVGSGALHAGLLLVVAFGVRAVRANQPELVPVEILEIGFAEIESEPPPPPSLVSELEDTAPQIGEEEVAPAPEPEAEPDPEPAEEPAPEEPLPKPDVDNSPSEDPASPTPEDNSAEQASEEESVADDADKIAPETKEKAAPPTLAKPDPESGAVHNTADERKDKGDQEGYASEGQEGEPFPFPEYLANIHRQVYRYFRPPQAAIGTVTIQFTILRDGSTTRMQIVSSSQDPLLDYTAMAAIEMAGKDGAFGPLPQGYARDRLVVTFDFKPAP